MAKTKIICTLGPASSAGPTMKKMAAAGMSVARLNFSHGTSAQHLSMIKQIRKINKKHHCRLKIMLDLEGPRIRIGKLKNHKPVNIKKGQIIYLVQGNIHGSGNTIPFDYEGSLQILKDADFIFIDDGFIALKIINISGKKVKTEATADGAIKEFKGVNVPGAKLKFSGLSRKDEDDISFGIEQRVDYIAQSFIRNAADILEVKEKVSPKLPSCRLVSKIENRDGINDIDGIIDASDGIMVARGDMGVSVPVYEVPIIQKTIIKKCNKKGKFVITATQMLETMVRNIRPTRAEVSDIANAILDGTDFVMLSEETAAGKHPVESVKMMANIISFTEQVQFML